VTAPPTSATAATAAGGTTTRVVGGRQVALWSSGTGRPLLYLHGLCDLHSAIPGDGRTAFLDALAAGQRTVLAPALPGYPGSSGLEDMRDVEDYVFHLLDLLDELGLGQVDLAGHSLGGWLAAELALRRPDRVRRLVLVSPLGLHVAGLAVPPVFGALAPRGVGGFGEARRLLFADPDGAPATDALPDDMSAEQQLRWFGGLAGAARLGWKAPHFQSRALSARVGRIRVPALVVCGESDRLVPEQAGRAWAGGMAEAVLVTVPGAGHALVLERPETAADVLGFLEPWS
jgi:pimeloyl-ACP methyl ester carboxylesterase